MSFVKASYWVSESSFNDVVIVQVSNTLLVFLIIRLFAIYDKRRWILYVTVPFGLLNVVLSLVCLFLIKLNGTTLFLLKSFISVCRSVYERRDIWRYRPNRISTFVSIRLRFSYSFSTALDEPKSADITLYSCYSQPNFNNGESNDIQVRTLTACN